MLVFAQATDAADSTNETDLGWLLIFGGTALVVFSVIYVLHRFWGRSTLSITFARLYGLLVVAILAVGLAFANLIGDTKTAAFTLLGTIAGYLAGARPTAAAVGPPPVPGGNGGGQPHGAQPTAPERWEEAVL